MFYEFPVTVPANTLQSAPVTQVCKLTEGIVHYVEIEFPAGCADQLGGAGPLVHVQIRQPEATYLPTNPDSSFASDDHIIPIREYKALGEGNNVLKIYAWNDDDTYAHTVIVRIGVLSQEQLEPTASVRDLLKRFLALLGVR